MDFYDYKQTHNSFKFSSKFLQKKSLNCLKKKIIFLKFKQTHPE
jgi:hypothetical protein